MQINWVLKGMLGAVMLGLAGCSYWQEKMQYGVFEYTQFMVRYDLDWEGGNTNREKVKLCASQGEYCVSADRIEFSFPGSVAEPDYRPQAPWLIVWPYEGQNTKPLYFDASNGQQLGCYGCTEQYQSDLTYKKGGTWFRNNTAYLFTSGYEFETREAYWVLHFSKQGVRAELIHAFSIPAQERSPIVRTNLNSKHFAWIECQEQCWLGEKDLATGKVRDKIAQCERDNFAYLYPEGAKCITKIAFDEARKQSATAPDSATNATAVTATKLEEKK
jgi:hypothetical protein